MDEHELSGAPQAQMLLPGAETVTAVPTSFLMKPVLVFCGAQYVPSSAKGNCSCKPWCEALGLDVKVTFF